MKRLHFSFLLFLFLLACQAEKENNNQPSLHFDKETVLAEASFRGADTGFGMMLLSGSNGTVFLSENNKWKALSVPNADSLDFRDAAILNDSTLLLLSAGNSNKSTIYKSTDKGKKWRLVFTNTFELAFFDGFDFWDEQNGVIISDAIDDKLYLLATTDAGETWNRIGEQSLPPLIKGEYGFAASGTGIITTNNTTIDIVTGGSKARLFSSSDKGQTWTVKNLPIRSGNPSSGIFSIDFWDAKTGIAAGGNYAQDSLANDNVSVTTNGESWTNPIDAKKIAFMSCVQFLTKDIILATGTSGTSISTDAGQHWEYIVEQPGYHTIAFDRNTKKGFLAGSKGRAVFFELF